MKTVSLLAVLSIATLAETAWSYPGAYIHWDRCDSYAYNKEFAGPGTYRQVVSAAGFDLPVRGHQFRLRCTATNVYNYPYEPLPDAWRFDPAGCQAGRLAARADGAGQPCPALAPGAATPSVDYHFDGLDLYLTFTAFYDLVKPDPMQNYVLAQLEYDHRRSAPGPQDPTQACGDVDEQVCFVIVDAVWYDPLLAPHPMRVERFWGVSWEEKWGVGCFGDVPVEPATWGRVKAVYR